MSIAGKEERKYVVVLLAAVFLVAISGVFLSGFDSFLLQDSENLTLYDIDSTSQWNDNAGILWTTQASMFEEGMFKIRDYGQWTYYGYQSAATYSTSEVNASVENLELDSLNATGYVGEGVDSALRMKIYDCSKHQMIGSPERVAETCYGDNIVYDSGLIETSGRVELNENLSNTTIDGYMHVGMEIMANTTEEPEDPSYWSSLRLTRQESKDNRWIDN